ncbi:MAG: MtrB/PioB family decaheme-associated outer membrane protein [Gammaproteobacteria bacterium]|nr:MtrB/PioB family decaheme-associated outer membrane protein [Gammaproteobacteria bacterium]
MRAKPRIVYTAICAVCLFPFAGQAQEEFVLEEGPAKPPAPVYTSEMELGVGYSSEDSFKFGEYSGLEEEGPYFFGNLTVRKASAYDDDSTEYWELTGTNLGLDSRNVRGEYGRQGLFGIYLDYDQIPHFQFEDGRTPFLGAGTSDQTLPADWVGATSTVDMTNLIASLRDVEIETDRKKFGGGISWLFAENWSLTGNYHHEIKDGRETLAAVFGTNGGNPRSQILVQPINYDFDEFDVSLSYTGKTAQAALTYHLSLFDNDDDALTFDNPYNDPGGNAWCFTPTCGGFGNSFASFINGGRGSISLPPENEAHQISFSGGYNLNSTARLTANVSYGRMNQDEDFLPMTVNPNFVVPFDLPQTDLDGQIDTWYVNLGLSARPWRKLDIRAQYVYDERDNDTPRDVYVRLPNDSGDQGTPDDELARINRTYDLKKHQFQLDAGYRMTPASKLSVGYEYEHKDRNLSEVANTDEHTGKVKLWASPGALLSGWVEYARSTRDGSTYVSNQAFLVSVTPEFLATLDPATEGYENDPLLRKFHLADRDRDRVDATVNFTPNDSLTFSVSGRYAKDDYDDSELGLQEGKSSSVTFDANYTPTKDISAYAFFTRDDFKYEQRGFQRSLTELFPGAVRDTGPFGTNGFWTMDIDDDIYTVGTGLEWSAIENKLNFKLDYTYSRAVTNTIPDGDPNLLFRELPELTMTLHSVGLTGEYQIRENLGLRLHYLYEYYKSKDFALDNVVPNTLANVILLGNDSQDYSAHVVGITLVYGF